MFDNNKLYYLLILYIYYVFGRNGSILIYCIDLTNLVPASFSMSLGSCPIQIKVINELVVPYIYYLINEILNYLVIQYTIVYYSKHNL